MQHKGSSSVVQIITFKLQFFRSYTYAPFLYGPGCAPRLEDICCSSGGGNAAMMMVVVTTMMMVVVAMMVMTMMIGRW